MNTCLNPNCINRRVPYSSYCCNKCEPIYLREGKPVYDDNPIESVYSPTMINTRRAGTRGWREPGLVPVKVKDLLELHEADTHLQLPREIVGLVVRDTIGHAHTSSEIPETAPSGLMDSTKQTYVIPLGTVVMIADKTMKLSQHTTKRENKFARECIILRSMSQPKMTLTYRGEHPVTVVPTEMLSVGYYTFDTKYPPFPYMVVPMTLFQDQMEYEQEAYEQGYTSNFVRKSLPYEPGTLARNPLTEKQQNRMRSTKKCPDCDGKKFVTGPSAGMATNMKCVDCDAKFNVHPMGIDRI